MTTLQVAGVVHPIPDVYTFVTPVFKDRENRLYIQIMDGHSIGAFKEIHVEDEFVPLDCNLFRTENDRALFGFFTEDNVYYVGTSDLLSVSVLKNFSDDNSRGSYSESTIRIIKKFSKDSSIYPKINSSVLAEFKRDHPPRVLVVDDSTFVTQRFRKLFERERLEVMTADNGLEALGAITINMPDVILLDIEMPKMNGYELISKLRKNASYAKIPVVVFTSHKEEDVVEKIQKTRFSAYISKSNKDTAVIKAVRNHLGMAARWVQTDIYKNPIEDALSKI